MPTLQRRKKRGYTKDTLLSISDFVVRRTNAITPGGLRLRWTNLSEDETEELVALTRDAEEGVGFDLSRLSEKKQQRWERLVGKCGGDPDYFPNHRHIEAIRALARQAHVERVRRPISRREESTILDELGRQLQDGFLGVEHMAALIALFIQLQSGVPLGPRASVERDDDGLPFLRLQTNYGLVGGDRDQRGLLAGFQKSLAHAERNAWVRLVRRGNEMEIHLGSRGRRTFRGEPRPA